MLTDSERIPYSSPLLFKALELPVEFSDFTHRWKCYSREFATEVLEVALSGSVLSEECSRDVFVSWIRAAFATKTSFHWSTIEKVSQVIRASKILKFTTSKEGRFK